MIELHLNQVPQTRSLSAVVGLPLFLALFLALFLTGLSYGTMHRAPWHLHSLHRLPQNIGPGFLGCTMQCTELAPTTSKSSAPNRRLDRPTPAPPLLSLELKKSLQWQCHCHLQLVPWAPCGSSSPRASCQSLKGSISRPRIAGLRQTDGSYLPMTCGVAMIASSDLRHKSSAHCS